jgi:hypothetical protein
MNQELCGDTFVAAAKFSLGIPSRDDRPALPSNTNGPALFRGVRGPSVNMFPVGLGDLSLRFECSASEPLTLVSDPSRFGVDLVDRIVSGPVTLCDS